MEAAVENRVIVRTITLEDLPRLVAMDRAYTGRTRRKWFEGKLKRAIADADLKISLGAEIDGTLVGAMLGALAYGEFGQPEPVAVLDTVLVDPARSRHGIGRAMLAQLLRNLAAIGITAIRTEVAWNEHDLLSFLGAAGFVPVPRLVLELDVARAATKLDEEEARG